MTHLARMILSLGAIAVLATGCGTTVAGTAVPDPNAPAVKLDTGGLSTKPRTPTAPGSQRKVLGANMVSERAVLLSDIDPTYVEGGAQTAVTARNFISLGTEDTDRIAKRGMVYGFSDRRSPVKNSNEGLSIYLIRMTDEAAAKGAVDDFRAEDGATEPFPERPEVSVRKTAPDDTFKFTRYTAYTAVGPLLTIVSPWATDENKARDLITKTIDAQKVKLTGFTSPGPSDIAGLPLDKDGIVSLTVTPEQIDGGTFNNFFGFFERPAALHWDDNPVTAAKIFDETGMDLVGLGRNTVYRTRDAAAAKRFADLAESEWLGHLVSAQPFTIDGLPDAKCRTHKLWEGSDNQLVTCYLAVGRYVSAFTDSQAVRVRQVTSAAYLILKHAE